MPLATQKENKICTGQCMNLTQNNRFEPAELVSIEFGFIALKETLSRLRPGLLTILDAQNGLSVFAIEGAQ